MSKSSWRARGARWAWSVHHWAGLLTGLAFFLTAASGFCLLFTDKANLMGRPPVLVGPQWASLAPALATVAERHPDYALTSVRLTEDPSLAWLVFLRHPQTQDRLVADLDPYTGQLLGVRDYDKTAFRVLLTLHYTYFAGTPGKILSTVVGLALLLLAGSGLWLYRGALKDLFRWRIQKSTSCRTGLLWLHKWTGLWTLVFACLWGITGLTFMWHILPDAFAPRQSRFVSSDPQALRALPNTADMLQKAQQALPGGVPYTLTPLSRGVNPGPSVRLLFRDNWPWEQFGEVRFDREGRIQKVVTPGSGGWPSRWDAAVTALHFGFFGRTPTLILYAVAGAVMIFLPLSGYLLWLARRRRPSLSP